MIDRGERMRGIGWVLDMRDRDITCIINGYCIRTTHGSIHYCGDDLNLNLDLDLGDTAISQVSKKCESDGSPAY